MFPKGGKVIWGGGRAPRNTLDVKWQFKEGELWRPFHAAAAGTQFAFFTGTEVQILT
jgi:hypothetical protein